MAGKGDTFENDLLLLLFNGTAITLLAQNNASPTTNLFIALHTASPGEAGTQATSESAYSGYTRATVARTSGGFTVTGSAATLTANVDFPTSGAAGTTITDFSIGPVISGATKIMYFGAVTPNIAIAGAGVIPRLTTASSVTED